MVIGGGVGVTCEGVRVAFYREIVAFWLAEVGGRSNGGLMRRDDPDTVE